MMSRQHRAQGPRAVGFALAAGLAVGLFGCTEEPEEPAPEPAPAVEDEEPAALLGAQVVVVLPPRTSLSAEVAAAMEDDLQRLADEYDEEVRVVRTRYPDDAVFVRDVAGLSVREGADLLCVFGAVGRQVTSDLRELHPASRFCAVTPNDPPEEPEDRVDIVALRVVELGHLLGAATVALADGEAVALALGPTELQRGRFREGLEAALGTTPIIDLDEEIPPEEAVTAAVEDGAAVVLVGTGPDAALQTEAAIEAGAQVITHRSLAGSGDEVALTWHIRWDLALAPAIDRFLGRSGPAELDLGLTDGIFELELGEGAPAGLEAVLAAVEELIVEGERDPFEAVEPEEPEEVDDGEDVETPDETGQAEDPDEGADTEDPEGQDEDPDGQDDEPAEEG